MNKAEKAKTHTLFESVFYHCRVLWITYPMHRKFEVVEKRVSENIVFVYETDRETEIIKKKDNERKIEGET
jgi:hypothetical protein